MALALRRLVLGLLHRTAERGGIFHQYLRSYALKRGDGYMLSRKHNREMAELAVYHRPMRLVTRNGRRRGLDSWTIKEPHRTWAYDWALRCLDTPFALEFTTVRLELDLLIRLYTLIEHALLESGLLMDCGPSPGDCMALDPDQCCVTSQVKLLRCQQCGHALTLADREAELFMGARCRAYRCMGTYGEDARPEQRYYRTIYSSGDIQRIYAKEHTSLLERNEREDIEKEFKDKGPADATNLLSCTPTLEMGIDIGDLSATLLASVPPAVANFVQRSGRAGRTTGNSVTVTMARTRAHDKYFFANPPEMIAGSVTAPGTFLNAPEMLARQLTAFCLDHWGRNTKNAQIPRNVSALLSSFTNKKFPYDLFAYAEQNRESLLATFFGMFKDVLDEENKARLRASAQSLQERMVARFKSTQATIKDLQRYRERMKDRKESVAKNTTLTPDEQKAEQQSLDQDIALVSARLKNIHNQWGLDYFVAEGFLPNYALSEPSVTLTSLIYNVPDQNGFKVFTDQVQRPAARAITELAPFNTFYAKGRKVVIDQVVAGTRDDKNADEDKEKRRSRVEQWAFCTACNHTEPWYAASPVKECPACKQPGFGEKGQVQDAVRLSEVTARQPHHASIALDDTDERTREYYRVRTLFDVKVKTGGQAWADEEKVFGYEWLPQVTLREFNLGPNKHHGPRVMISGVDEDVPGFHVCDDCGIVVDPRRIGDERQGRMRHLPRCRSRTSGERFRPLLLYREMHSEAIRVLLPVSSFHFQERMANFKAALALGLRLKFGGRPMHLVEGEYAEPVPDEGGRRRFLMLYDAVEGGTGYLKEFIDKPQTFTRLFELALARMQSCSCLRSVPKPGEDPVTGDGCYRCLFMAADKRDLEMLSKREAMDLVGNLLRRGPQWKEVKTLSAVAMDMVTDSELEERFLHAFLELAKARGFKLDVKTSGTSPVHELKRGKEKIRITGQVALGPEEGVSQTTIADFVIHRVKDKDGNPMQDKPIAVYCDGFAFHAHTSDGGSRIADDIAKRTAILRSGTYRIWNVTWQDVEKEKLAENPPAPVLTPEQQKLFTMTWNGPLKANRQHASILLRNNVEALMDLVTEHPQRNWEVMGAAAFAALLGSPPRFMKEEDWEGALQGLPDTGLTAFKPALNAQGPLVWGERRSLHTLVAASIPRSKAPELAKCNVADAKWVLHLDDDPSTRGLATFKEEWRLFLSMLNVLQALPMGRVQSMQSLEQHVGGLVAVTAVKSTSWAEAVEASVHDLAVELAAMGVPEPEHLSDLGLPNSPHGNWGQSELSWADRRVAVLNPTQAQEFELEAARQAGWKVFVVGEGNLEELKAWLKEGA